MPKIVDHDEQRSHLLEATWRVIARDGFRGATTRAVAREAGYTSGLIAHYFKNKDDMLLAAHRMLYVRAMERVREVSETMAVSGLSALRFYILQALPLDEARLTEAIVDIGFVGEALSNDLVRKWRTAELLRHRDDWLALIEDCRNRGELTTAATNDQLISRFEVLIDGISLQAVLHPELMPESRQVEIIDTTLAEISMRPA